VIKVCHSGLMSNSIARTAPACWRIFAKVITAWPSAAT
jgi:hypothetical protein